MLIKKVEILFDDNKLKKIVNDMKSLQKAYGQIGANLIRRRLDDLSAAKTLEDVRFLPGKYHELGENRKGQLAVHVKEPYRLIFVPNHNPIPMKENGALCWTSITSIKVIEIANYHD